MHIHSAVRKPTDQHLSRSDAAPEVLAQHSSSIFLLQSKPSPYAPCMSCTVTAHPPFVAARLVTGSPALGDDLGHLVNLALGTTESSESLLCELAGTLVLAVAE